MTRQIILFEDKYENINFINAELIKDKKDLKLYHTIDNSTYNALKIQDKQIKFLDAHGKVRKNYSLVKIIDYVPETLKIVGCEHYTDVRNIIVKKTNFKKKIEMSNSKNSKISVNGFEVRLIPSGFAPIKWDVNVLNNGESKFVEVVDDGVIVGFNEPIDKIQLIEDWELN